MGEKKERIKDLMQQEFFCGEVGANCVRPCFTTDQVFDTFLLLSPEGEMSAAGDREGRPVMRTCPERAIVATAPAPIGMLNPQLPPRSARDRWSARTRARIPARPPPTTDADTRRNDNRRAGQR